MGHDNETTPAKSAKIHLHREDERTNIAQKREYWPPTRQRRVKKSRERADKGKREGLSLSFLLQLDALYGVIVKEAL